jgi:hypothetical protein
MVITQVVIPSNLGVTIKPNHLTANKYDVDAATLISGDAGNDIIVGTDGKLKLVETVTTVDSIEVVGPNIVLKSTNESGTQSQVSMPVADICATCSACFEVGNTLEYTNATKPATGSAGQIIYVSDVTATDGSTGTPMIWQVNTNSWKKVSIS